MSNPYQYSQLNHHGHLCHRRRYHGRPQHHISRHRLPRHPRTENGQHSPNLIAQPGADISPKNSSSTVNTNNTSETAGKPAQQANRGFASTIPSHQTGIFHSKRKCNPHADLSNLHVGDRHGHRPRASSAIRAGYGRKRPTRGA